MFKCSYEYKFTRPVNKDGSLTRYALLLLDVHYYGRVYRHKIKDLVKSEIYEKLAVAGKLEFKGSGGKSNHYVLSGDGKEMIKKIMHETTDRRLKTPLDIKREAMEKAIADYKEAEEKQFNRRKIEIKEQMSLKYQELTVLQQELESLTSK